MSNHGIGYPVTNNEHGDFLVCLCGNDPTLSGYEPCLEDGTIVEPVIGGPWQEALMRCLGCGRIIDITQNIVVGWASLEER